MSRFQFSFKSKQKLETCHIDIQTVLDRAIDISPIDFGISEGYRSIEKQQEYYAQGRTAPGKIITYIDGVNKKGKHNFNPSQAVDIYAFVNGKRNWSKSNMFLLAGLILSISEDFFEKGIISNKLAWGGFWNSFKDYPHYEI